MPVGERKGVRDERALLAPPAQDVPALLPPPVDGGAETGRSGSVDIAATSIATLRRIFRRSLSRGFQNRPDIGSRLVAAALHEWERGTAFLFAPVCLCLGVLIYFSLEVEPAFSELSLTAAFLAAAAFLARGSILARHLLVALMLLVAGMGAGKFETWRAGTKMLGGEISTRITGRVVQIEHRASGRVRLTIDVLATERPKLRYAPDRIRASARSIPDAIVTGSGVSGVVRLRQPSGPVRPGSYDFAFKNYFDGIGASGFFLGAPSPVALAEPAPLATRAAAWLERLRDALAARIRNAVGGPEGAIAAALITGVTAAIPEEANEAMRLSGIYHVISISGLHLALVAGTVMVSLRAGLALFPGFASRRPIKKYAAAIALLTVFFYLFLSGAEVATQRSFIMLAVMLLALLFDRAALTMRNLAIAAMVVILISPHEVAGPSFQMSFAATAALIAAYAAWSERRAASPGSPPAHRSAVASMLRYVLLYGGGIAMTSIVAGTATALFGAWHFNRVAPLGLLANLLAMPVVSLLVMPFAVMAMMLMPFGLDHPPLAIMGKGVALMMAVAEWVAARSPFDVIGIIPVGAVVLLSAALVLLTMTTTALRLAAIPLLIGGVIALAMREPPAVLVAEDGRLVAVSFIDGRLAVNRSRPNGFTIDNWTRALAAAEIVRPVTSSEMTAAASLTEAPLGPATGFSCSGDLCLVRHRSGAVIAHSTDAASAMQACGLAALIVLDDATVSPNICAGKSVVITKRDLARRGSAEVRFRETAIGLRTEIAHAIQEPYRPWHAHRAFSREARGMPPYSRPGRQEEPTLETSAGQSAASGTRAGLAASAGAAERPAQ